MRKTYKQLFFDLDHTLWDFEKNSEITLAQIYQEYDLDTTGIPSFQEFSEVYSAHNNRLWERFRKGFIKREELRWKRMWLTLLDFQVRDLELAQRMSVRYLEILPRQTALIPYAKELLDYCKGKYPLHLITNGFETTQWEKLRHSGLDNYFDQVITSEKASNLKPHREIFDYAVTVSGSTATDCIMIGDALDVDVLGARNAGWDQVYYNPLKVPHKAEVTYEVACLSELLHIL